MRCVPRGCAPEPVQCPRAVSPCSVRAPPPPPPLVQQCPYSACPVSMHCPVQPPCSVPVQCLCSVPRAVPIQCPVHCPCNAPMQCPVQCPCAAPRAVPPVQCPCSVGLYAGEGSCGLWIHFVTRQKKNSLWQSRVGQGRRPQSLGRRCPRRRDRCSDSVTPHVADDSKWPLDLCSWNPVSGLSEIENSQLFD